MCYKTPYSGDVGGGGVIRRHIVCDVGVCVIRRHIACDAGGGGVIRRHIACDAGGGVL